MHSQLASVMINGNILFTTQKKMEENVIIFLENSSLIWPFYIENLICSSYIQSGKYPHLVLNKCFILALFIMI